jgi:hypothetical protein
MVVLECTIPASDVALESLLGTFPDVVVETERLVPTNHSPLPYLWTDDRCGQEFYEALASKPSVDRAGASRRSPKAPATVSSGAQTECVSSSGWRTLTRAWRCSRRRPRTASGR